MNNKRRKDIKTAYDILQAVLTEEELAYENMPENLQSSIKGEQSEEAIDILEDVISALEDIM